jgi:hypothetical protein
MEFFLDLTIPQWVIILTWLYATIGLLILDFQKLYSPGQAKTNPWLTQPILFLVMGVGGMVLCAGVFLFLLPISYHHVAIWIATVQMTVITCKALEVYRLKKNLQ